MTPEEYNRYAWQLDIPGHGEAGQRKLKAASVLISRAGGVGGTAALYLAAAGIGRLVLAHAGDLRLDDLNRQLLMRTEGVGRPRLETAAETLRGLNPGVEVTAIQENVNPENASRLVGLADIVIDAAPLFEERLPLLYALLGTLLLSAPPARAAAVDLQGRNISFSCS